MEAPIVLGILIFTLAFLTILMIGIPSFMEEISLRYIVYQRAFEASDYVAKACTGETADINKECVRSRFNDAKKLSVFVGGEQFGDTYKGRETVYRVRRVVMFGGTPSMLEVSTWY